jgi:hypothetical protein
MLTTTHLLVAVLIGLVLNLNRDEWFVALLFGVAIDLDHVFAAPRYISQNGWAAILRPTWSDTSGLPWRSLLHDPVAAFVVAPLSFGWRYFLPLLFWGAHLGIDYLQSATLAYSTSVEIVVIALCVAGIISIQYGRWRALRPDAGFLKYVAHVRSTLRVAVKGTGASILQRLGST